MQKTPVCVANTNDVGVLTPANSLMNNDNGAAQTPKHPECGIPYTGGIETEKHCGKPEICQSYKYNNNNGVNGVRCLSGKKNQEIREKPTNTSLTPDEAQVFIEDTPTPFDEAIATVMENGTPEAYAVAFVKMFLGPAPNTDQVDQIGMALDRRDYAGAIRLGLRIEPEASR